MISGKHTLGNTDGWFDSRFPVYLVFRAEGWGCRFGNRAVGFRVKGLGFRGEVYGLGLGFMKSGVPEL